MIPVQHAVKPDYERFTVRANDLRILAYLGRVRDRFRLVSTLGLPQSGDRTDIPIDRLFVPLAVTWTEPDGDDGDRTRRTAQPELLVAARQRVVLLGQAGSGKTTFVNWLSFQLAERGRNDVHRRVGELVPLTFVLRDLPITEQITTWEALRDLLAASPVWAASLDDALPQLLDAGQLLFIFDGWDEIADVQLRRALADAIRDTMQRFPVCSYLLTSRPEGFAEVPLAAPPDDSSLALVQALVQPFEPPQVRAFVHAWYRWRAPDDADARASALIQAIDDDPALQALARVPNQLAMLALVHRRFTHLPGSRTELLARVTDAFVEGWESAPGQPRPSTPVAMRKRWLQELALVMTRRRVWGASHDDIQRLADRSPQAAQRVQRLQSGTVVRRDKAAQLMVEYAQDGVVDAGPPDALAFLDWCLRRSGLLVPRGPDSLAFAHLILQDWLAAGAMVDRLRSAWVDDALARATAGELSRWAMRAAGGQTVLLTLEWLRAEQPDMADQLAVEIFAERAAGPAQHRRLYDLAQVAGEDDKLSPDMDIIQDAAGPLVLRDATTIAADQATAAHRCVYLLDCPALTDLSPLAHRPAEHPTRRTLYLKHTGVTGLPPGLPWRVVDEHGLVYSPEEGPLRPPHQRP